MDRERYNAGETSHEDQAERLKELEAENTRLKHAVAVLTVDKLILEEVAGEKLLEKGREDIGPGDRQ